jgi:nucleotide-binding universal stress UspA family protein
MLQLKTILHPTDFSDAAQQALQLARSLARDHGAKLVLISVPPPVTPITEAYVPMSEMEGQLEETRRQLADLAATITDVPVEHQALYGSPGPAIVAVAEKCQADMIVMGTHGRTGLTRLVLGSVAEYVMHHAGCPVLTMKPRSAARTGGEAAAEKTATHPR